jgi:hypothetical protein
MIDAPHICIGHPAAGGRETPRDGETEEEE